MTFQKLTSNFLVRKLAQNVESVFISLIFFPAGLSVTLLQVKRRELWINFRKCWMKLSYSSAFLVGKLPQLCYVFASLYCPSPDFNECFAKHANFMRILCMKKRRKNKNTNIVWKQTHDIRAKCTRFHASFILLPCEIDFNWFSCVNQIH